MNKRQALERFAKFVEFERVTPAFLEENEAQWQEFAAKFAVLTTKTELIEFWQSTKELTWPESWGQTPWEFTTGVAYFVAYGETVTEHRLASVEGRAMATAVESLS